MVISAHFRPHRHPPSRDTRYLFSHLGPHDARPFFIPRLPLTPPDLLEDRKYFSFILSNHHVQLCATANEASLQRIKGDTVLCFQSFKEK